jgi:exosortase A
MSDALRRVLVVWLLIAVVTVLYWPTPLSYAVAWTDAENKGNTHGFLIALMCIALIYVRRDKLARPIPRVSLGACLVLVGLSLLWLVAYRASIQTAHQLLFPLILAAAVYAVFGPQIGRACLFAVGFLYFALPFWGFINGPLQALTVVATRGILRLIGVPVEFYGNFIHIPEGTFAIEGGCSGLHFLVVAMAIAAYYGELHRDSLRHRMLLGALAVVLALLTNWIRVSVIITAGHLTHMQSYLVRVSHYGFGWAVFAVAMAAFFLLALRIPPPLNAAVSTDGGQRTEPAAQPIAFAVALVVAALAPGPALALMAARADATATLTPPQSTFVRGWSGPLRAPTDWTPVFKGADREFFAMYRRGSAAVEWYSADYAFQHQGKKLFGYDNSLISARMFNMLDQGVVDAGSVRFNYLQLRNPEGAQSVLWYAYEVGAHDMTSGLLAQLWYGARSLTGPVESRVSAFRAKCDPDCTAAHAELRRFVDSICDNASRFGDCRRDP